MSKLEPTILAILESLDVNDSSGTKGRVALLQSFAKAGYRVTALHYTQKKIELEGIECISVKEHTLSGWYLLSRIQRVLYRWFGIKMGNTVERLIGFSFGFLNDSKGLTKALKKLDPEAFDMVWTLSKGNSYRSHRAVLSLPEWHKNWYAYVHDPYPQQLYPRPYNFVPRGYKQKRMFLRQVTLKAKRVVFPSLLLKEWLQSYYTALHGKSLIIPHQISQPSVSEQEFPEYFDPKKFNLVHGGNLLDLRDPKPIFEAYAAFLDQVPEAKESSALLFLGKESAFTKYMNDFAEQIPQIYVSSGYVPFKQTYAMQQAASVNIILEAISEISPFLPGKFPHCVAADAPIFVVGPYYSECKRVLGSEHPYVFEFSEIEKMTTAMIQLYKEWLLKDGDLQLHRPDLKQYLSSEYVKKVLKEQDKNLLY